MKIIKTINNNYAIAVDASGTQLIVSGKGIGYGAVPREICDLTVINRSFYDVDENLYSMIKSFPEKIITIATAIVDRARNTLESSISSNVIFTLSDHITFAVKRYEENININLPITYEIQNMYDQEYSIGLFSLKLIKERLGIELPKQEAAYIALQLITAETYQSKAQITDDRIIAEIVSIVEEFFSVNIDRDGFNYSRFTTHLTYLIKRGRQNIVLESNNSKLYKKTKEDYSQINQCTEMICQHLYKTLGIELSDEEKLYLILHINRVCSREDRNPSNC